MIGVVCDGAGSAREGRLGAQTFATEVAAELAQALAAQGDAPLQEGRTARALLLQAVGAVRVRVAIMAAERQLASRDFACTLVGCAVAPSGGVFFHVGDGFGVCLRETGESVLSLPENGEYADETYFVTDDAWEEHLRVAAIPEPRFGCVIGLMSDGASPFAIDRQRKGFFRPFLDPVIAFLAHATQVDGDAALRGVLDSERAQDITPDDKALLIAMAV
jgi:hypothetical protein